MESENSEADNSIIDESVAKASTSKKRGRPKKSDQLKNETHESHAKTESSINEDKKNERRCIKKPKRYLDMETEQRWAEEFVSPSTTKKNRHRSQTRTFDGEKKEVEENKINKCDEETLNLSFSKEDFSGKKKGRPKKKVHDTSLENESQDITNSEIPNKNIDNFNNDTSDGMQDSNTQQKGNKVVNEQEAKNEETPSGRKRGRSKAKKNISEEKIVNNVQNDVLQFDHDSNYITPIRKKSGRYKKPDIQNKEIDSEQEDKNDEKDETLIETTNSGKKRGRPKKKKNKFSSQKEVDGFDEEFGETSDLVDKSGNSCSKQDKPKDLVTPNKQEEQKVNRKNSTGSAGKRLPGRPRKSESPSEPPPKKRGKPKKNLEDELQSAKKKRKVSITSSDEEEVTRKSVTIKSKKERPKKYARKNMEENPENEIESPLKDAIKCVHCEEKFWDKAKLKLHMMKTHCAVWSSDCPEGKSDNAALKIILKRLGKIPCPKCGKEIKWIQYYRKHEEWCGREEEVSDCPICNRPIMTMWIKEHVQIHKKQERLEEERRLAQEKKDKEEPVTDSQEQTNRGGKKRSAAKKAQNLLHQINEKGDLVDQNTVDYASDAEILSEASDDDDENDDEVQESDEIISESETEDVISSNKSEVKTEKCLPYNYIGIGLKDTLRSYRKIYGTSVLFPEYIPQKSNWTMMDGDVKEYLPTVTESVSFIVNNKNQKSRKKSCSTQTNMTKIELFNSVIINDSSNIFVGGPIWGLEWCPVPMATGQFDNYLAVSCELIMRR
ncbi:hypothetical protein KUTeg_010596 [Tegillarca granosa]|uniref:C2H2-type domain-containing protein n=1 Tax=Tegillarca granosa TaxID=220873 RepID=A0ABQ9F8D0_TEGGR|nr:hypothetical protein KUTeg_010596 [Tegillarca granosa]